MVLQFSFNIAFQKELQERYCDVRNTVLQEMLKHTCTVPVCKTLEATNLTKFFSSTKSVMGAKNELE